MTDPALIHADLAERIFKAIRDGFNPGELGATVARIVAEDAVRVVAMAGRLLPEPVETREGWGLRWPDGYVKHNFTGREAAENYEPCNPDDVMIELVRREVQVFADGRTLIGTWVPVPDPQEGA